MNISIDKTDALNATVIIELNKEDYTEKVNQGIKRIQKTSSIKGFRPGKAPADMVKKMYGKSVLAEEIQNMANEALNKYIEENKLDLLGYPMYSSRIESDIDIDNKEEFKFAFDLGFAPEFELSISDKDRLELFKIEVTDKEIDEDITYARNRYGKMEDIETAEAEDIIYCNVSELDEAGNLLDGGIADKQVSLVASLIQDEDLKKQFIGISKGATLQVNIFKMFNSNEAVIASSLGIQKEGVADLNSDFKVEITDIKRRTAAELNEDYFKEVFGPVDFPKNEEEYRARVKSNLENYYKNEADLWLDHQIGHLLMEKHSIELPDDFLKRWLLATKTEDYNAENIDQKYAEEKSALQRRLIIDKIQEKHEIMPTEAEIREEARIYYFGLYRQYGLNISPEDGFLDSTINKKLGEREFVSQMADRVVYRKAYDKVKEMVSLDEKNVTVEEYFNHINAHKHEHGEQ